MQPSGEPRAAYLAGFDGTSNLQAGERFGIPVSGTHSHAWVQDFDSELEAFRAFAKAYPDDSVLLVDTYDTLRSGVPHAIQVGLELKEQGIAWQESGWTVGIWPISPKKPAGVG